ncbi:MAG: family 1 olfactory receptor [Chthoniobacter sp.]|nr:family 1 olfactory receptor [Chthoniobacter sp.]
MSLPKEFFEKLPLKRDEELRDMLANPADYLPEAIAAAQAEWDKRAISTEKLAEMEARTRVVESSTRDKAQESLSWCATLFAFVLAFGLWPVICAVYCYSRGYKRKAFSFISAMVVGLIFYGLLGVFYFSPPK